MEQKSSRSTPPTSSNRGERGPLSTQSFRTLPHTRPTYKAFGYRDPESDGVVQTLSNN